MQPGEGIDPFTDKRFKVAKTFGEGAVEVSLFRFDLE